MVRPNLGQNATQLYNIMVHLPFMFVHKFDQLQQVWPIMTSLLRCMRVLFSHTIAEHDISQFVEWNEEHLGGMVTVFMASLKPKQHHSIHYAHVIRTMGPPILMWMMRYEAKHKFFTDAAKRTNNFVNITKTLSYEHQSYISSKMNSYHDEIQPSKKNICFLHAQTMLSINHFCPKSTIHCR